MMKKELLQQTRMLLQYHEELGIESIPLTEEVQSFLIAKPLIAQRNNSIGNEGNGAKIVQLPPNDSLLREKTNLTIDEINQEIRVCKSCNLVERRFVPVCGRGKGHIRLLVVGDWLKATANISKEEIGQRQLIFGNEEDLMLARMFKAINLDREEVYVTNLIKCGIQENVQPQAENLAACSSYLSREISVLEPSVICVMGPVSSRFLLGGQKPLSQMRGRFHPYRVSEKSFVPVMATYHPSFLLRNPEMKRATWEDLQQIEKKLREIP